MSGTNGNGSSNGSGRYRMHSDGLDDDEPPTRPETPIARITPAHGTPTPLTVEALRAEFDAFKREMVEAVRDALSDARVVSDRGLRDHVERIDGRVGRLEQSVFPSEAPGG